MDGSGQSLSLSDLLIGHSCSLIIGPPANTGSLTVARCSLSPFTITAAHLGPDRLTEVLQVDSLKVTEVRAVVPVFHCVDRLHASDYLGTFFDQCCYEGNVFLLRMNGRKS